jgi:hypothetical protein
MYQNNLTALHYPTTNITTPSFSIVSKIDLSSSSHITHTKYKHNTTLSNFELPLPFPWLIPPNMLL